MNLVVMAAMMAAMWLLFHGKSNHAPEPKPERPVTHPDRPGGSSEPKSGNNPDREPKLRSDRSDEHSIPRP